LHVLVTGNAGRIGRNVVEDLVAREHTIRGFDRPAMPRDCSFEHHPGDVRDIHAVRRAASGVDAVVHLAAIANDRRGAEDDVLTTNVQGTWNLLLACREAGVSRFVLMSSINSLGNFGGHRPSKHLPIDDTYPHHPMTPYQMSKHLAEELCRVFSDAYGMVTLCVRAVYVAFPDHYGRWREHRGPWRREWGRGDYWAYVDVREVCEAVARSLEVEGVSHEAFILSAPDTTSDAPTAELVAEHYPDTPWVRDKDAYLSSGPFVSLLDCSHVQRVLGWRPSRSWRSEE
jgi:nucleoside-diphosphate-sugar epimerase